ncbi:DNA alkylation repair protein [Sphaerotilus sp.]|uniref:DNA alkylation repair protein n=1 Tax=Sphaerotilus sp. TaxID=2093942 RepID=UPI002ACED9FE|nr:DNA alkylation repair protein [Sphaerotilus sp.]MDZ7855689.1 DNA alkylation repair protein [Sphaerotilus sp.]
MAEPFKMLLDPAVVRAIGMHLQRVAPSVERVRFEQLALDGLDALELKARAMQIADALEATLPAGFEAGAAILEATLAPVTLDAELGSLRTGPDGLAGWALWPLGEWVARRGLDDPHRALQALHALTQRFTAEWAIRPLLLRHPDTVFATLRRWCDDPSPHVRRLVSEGSRPRLPWGLQLRPLIADPTPTLPLLAALQDDPSPYVRRSVANHLNDIAKDHPAVVADWLRRYLPEASAERRALLRHASRSLVKAGDVAVLVAWGQGAALEGCADLAVTPAQITLGERVALSATLTSLSRRPQALVVDYVIHHVKANGSTSPKVFKGWNLTLAPGETRTLVKQHAVRPITTRVYYPGQHRVALQVNGAVVADAAFELLGLTPASGQSASG